MKSNKHNPTIAGEVAYQISCLEDKLRLRRIQQLRAQLDNVVAALFNESEVECGCWVPHLERIEFCKMRFDDSMQKAVSNWKASIENGAIECL